MTINAAKLLSWQQIRLKREFVAIPPETTAYEAAKIMRNNRVSAIAVVNQNNALEGIFSVNDFTDAILDGLDPNSTSVIDVMTPFDRLQSISSEAEALDCAQILLAIHTRHLPIVDEENVFQGMLSIRDVLRGLVHVISEYLGKFTEGTLHNT